MGQCITVFEGGAGSAGCVDVCIDGWTYCAMHNIADTYQSDTLSHSKNTRFVYPL
jgi:hypothetical protein